MSRVLVKEGAPLVQSVYGRPSTPLSIAGGSVCGIGIQINTDGYHHHVEPADQVETAQVEVFPPQVARHEQMAVLGHQTGQRKADAGDHIVKAIRSPRRCSPTPGMP